MSLTSLPAELLEAIFDPLSPSTLAALALTNGDLYASATRMLYRHVAVSSFTRNLSAVHTLATRSHLSHLVRSFSICMEDGREQVDDAYSSTLLYQALRGMKNLTDLEVHVDTDHSWVLFDDSRSPHCTHYPSLESFSCSFPLDAHVARFLEGTPALLSLQVATSPDAAHLAPSAAPLLAAYTGPPCALAQLLPLRPLTTLLLSGDLTLAHVDLLAGRTLAPAAAPRIETLSAITSAPVGVIEALATACPGLTNLRVITTCPHWETPDTSFCGRIANSLASLPLLGAFELAGMHWEFRPRSTSSLHGICPEKEWLSPPVSPRAADMDVRPLDDNDYDFEDAFMEWAY